MKGELKAIFKYKDKEVKVFPVELEIRYKFHTTTYGMFEKDVPTLMHAHAEIQMSLRGKDSDKLMGLMLEDEKDVCSYPDLKIEMEDKSWDFEECVFQDRQISLGIETVLSFDIMTRWRRY